MKVFILVLARDEKHVDAKIRELESLGVPYLVVCGKPLNRANVVYREKKGKYDAINFGFNFVPKDIDILVLNDVDTKVHNLEAALECFSSDKVALVFGKVEVKGGAQVSFYSMLDPIRRRLPVTASGELMLVKRDVIKRILPIQPCKAEDSCILFKVSEFKRRIVFCEECYSETWRTKIIKHEEDYKRRTVCGLYQALGYTKPSPLIRSFYLLLPFASPLLLVFGKKGYHWMSGILLGLTDYLRGDRTGVWQPT